MVKHEITIILIFIIIITTISRSWAVNHVLLVAPWTGDVYNIMLVCTLLKIESFFMNKIINCAAMLKNWALWTEVCMPSFFLSLPRQISSQVCKFHQGTVYRMPAYDAEFDAAKERLSKLQEEPDNTVKLQIYALFKQVKNDNKRYAVQC